MSYKRGGYYFDVSFIPVVLVNQAKYQSKTLRKTYYDEAKCIQLTYHFETTIRHLQMNRLTLMDIINELITVLQSQLIQSNVM